MSERSRGATVALPWCPACGGASVAVALLTSHIAYLRCNACTHRWHVAPEWSAAPAPQPPAHTAS